MREKKRSPSVEIHSAILLPSLFSLFSDDFFVVEMKTNTSWALRLRIHRPTLQFSQIVSEQRCCCCCINKSLWGWLKPKYTEDNRRRLHTSSARLASFIQRQTSPHQTGLSPSPLWGVSFKVTWPPGTRPRLTPEALPLSPGEASGTLLRQRVVVGVFLWCVEQHLSVRERQKHKFYLWKLSVQAGIFTLTGYNIYLIPQKMDLSLFNVF